MQLTTNVGEGLAPSRGSPQGGLPYRTAGASAAHAGISVVTYIVINGMIHKTEVSFAGIPNLPEALAILITPGPSTCIPIALYAATLNLLTKFIFNSPHLRRC